MPAFLAPAGHPEARHPGIAAVLSFFWTGLGQIYNGEIGKGIAFLVLSFLSCAAMAVLVGFVTTPILWLLGIIDAYHSARRINAELGIGAGPAGR